MTHRSRLTQAIAPRSCRICGCTDEKPCMIDGLSPDGGLQPCSWAAADLCSNPECLEAFEAQLGFSVACGGLGMDT